jgi:hypothetical protein
MLCLAWFRESGSSTRNKAKGPNELKLEHNLMTDYDTYCYAFASTSPTTATYSNNDDDFRRPPSICSSSCKHLATPTIMASSSSQRSSGRMMSSFSTGGSIGYAYPLEEEDNDASMSYVDDSATLHSRATYHNPKEVYERAQQSSSNQVGSTLYNSSNNNEQPRRRPPNRALRFQNNNNNNVNSFRSSAQSSMQPQSAAMSSSFQSSSFNNSSSQPLTSSILSSSSPSQYYNQSTATTSMSMSGNPLHRVSIEQNEDSEVELNKDEIRQLIIDEDHAGTGYSEFYGNIIGGGASSVTLSGNGGASSSSSFAPNNNSTSSVITPITTTSASSITSFHTNGNPLFELIKFTQSKQFRKSFFLSILFTLMALGTFLTIGNVIHVKDVNAWIEPNSSNNKNDFGIQWSMGSDAPRPIINQERYPISSNIQDYIADWAIGTTFIPGIIDNYGSIALTDTTKFRDVPLFWGTEYADAKGVGGGSSMMESVLGSCLNLVQVSSVVEDAADSSGGGGGGGSSNNLLTNGTNSGVSSSPSSGSGASGPLGIIIHGKDGGRWIRFSTSSYTDAARAHEALNTYAFPGRRNLGYLFAFESRRTEVMASSGGGGTQQMGGGSGEGGGNPIATATPPTRRRFVAMEEFSRQGIVKGSAGPVGGVTHSTPWTVIHANAKNYGLCSTYPSVLVVPRSIVGSDDGNNLDSGAMGVLRRCAAFRSENRFPVLTWGSSEHGGSIWRSSQPKVGLQGYRSSEDERYLYAIGEEAKRANLAADARADGGVGSGSSHRPPIEFLRMLCGRNNESDLIMEGSNSSCMLKIMDMRPKSAAMANRTQGYGYENTNYYRGSTINFYGIGNIHAVRDAYQKVNALCLNPNTSDIQWMQLVENTNWPSMTRLILSASWQTAFHVHYNRLPILLHCSHGWDRTSQVSALAQLLLDPHYRTREGFSTLVEKDFLSFGHPFHTRSGHGEGKNEQGGDEGQLSPIFLQFLDCVFQLVNQFPNYFEFNARYLLLLSENIYSCRFGTLLCDSEREREVVAGIRQRTYCMWDHLDSISDLVNPLFDKAANADAGVLMMPLPMLLRNVTLWTDRLCMYGAKATIPCMPTVGSDMDRITNLHTSVDETTGSLQRAIADSHMWKETALTALKEVEELKMKLSEKNE